MNHVLSLKKTNKDDSLSIQDNWYARLELEYKKKSRKTVLAHRLHKGPLVVQKPFYPETDVCHSYLIHPPGGIVGGDILELDVVLHPKSHALITSPAANKFYRSIKSQAFLKQKMKVKSHASLEWLPQETIFYNECNTAIHTEFDLEDDAHLTCWEINCFGRPAGNEYFKNGFIKQKISIKRNGLPIYIDRNIFDAKTGILDAKWGINNFPVMATMLVTLPNLTQQQFSEAINIDEIEKLQQHCDKRIISFTRRDELLIIRYFGYYSREALEVFTECWAATRPQLIQKKICPPRIWAT